MTFTIPTDIRRLDPQAVAAESDQIKKNAHIQYLAQENRVDVLDLLHDKGTGHWGGSSSVSEILTTLYFDGMNIRPDEPEWADRDRVVISKGHAAPMIYTVMAKRGYFPVEELDSLRQINSRLQGHPCMRKLPGVELSTGALGHGISVCTGIALASNLQKRETWTWCIVGEGCLNEGESWEGIMTAAKFKTNRFVVLVDHNKVQLDGPCDDIMPLGSLADKFRAFGFTVADHSYDGHDVNAIQESLAWAKSNDTSGPLCIIYDTHKGHGVDFMSDNYKWHGAPIGVDDYQSARPQLVETLKELEASL